VPRLAEALARVIRDDQLRTRLGQAGPQRITEGFLAEQMVEAYHRLYRDVMQEWQTESVHRSLRA
jgi:glycosyltransferase involved in cell wall biosynthesis